MEGKVDGIKFKSRESRIMAQQLQFSDNQANAILEMRLYKPVSYTHLTQQQAQELGISVLPMPFMIEGKTFFEGISLSQEEFYQKLKTGAAISTSQPSPESVSYTHLVPPPHDF